MSLDFGLRDLVLHADFSDSGQSEKLLYGDLQKIGEEENPHILAKLSAQLESHLLYFTAWHLEEYLNKKFSYLIALKTEEVLLS